jgi:hypothetical protein
VSVFDLLGAGREIGARFSLVGLLPTVVLGLFVLSLLLSGAPGDAPSLDRIGDRAEGFGAWETALIFLALLGVALVLQPFQTPMVRLLEGYWGTRWPGAWLTKKGVERQGERFRKLDELSKTPLSGPQDPRAAAVVEAGAELQRLFPEDAAALLPTRLGNVMRSGETRAGAPYGLEAVVVWPRLYTVLGDSVRALVDDRRDQLDLSARFCVVFAIAAIASFALLVQHPLWLLVPAGCVALAWLAYRGTVGAALAHNEALRVAFDLHRFDLLAELHLPLPKTRQEEIELNQDLSAFLLQDWEVDLKYEHPS